MPSKMKKPKTLKSDGCFLIWVLGCDNSCWTDQHHEVCFCICVTSHYQCKISL